jgi:glycosyltransferase involved in cell wall biosynthesis
VQTVVINSYHGMVWGDECMARGLADGFRRLGHTAEVVSAQTHRIARGGFDVMIAMYPTGEIPGLPYRVELPRSCLNLYWAQVPGHFRLAERDPRFSGFLFASRAEMAGSGAREKLWLPMSADPEAYRPVPAVRKLRDVVFCANNIVGRSQATLARYLDPLLDIPGLELAIHGSGWEGTRYAALARGPIPPPEVPALYCSSKVVLSVHGDSHFAADMPTSRIFEAAACECAILSDLLPTGREIFGDAIMWTTGGEDARRKALALLGDDAGREALGRRARAALLADFTFDAHARRIAAFVEQLRAGGRP